MKIIYSPHYDGEIFLGDQPEMMGVKYVGTLGLLEELGLRTGIRNKPMSDVEREANYLYAMQKHIIKTPFEKASKVDPIGVASKLMRWRDDLIMAGWDKTVQASTHKFPKLSLLAAIEADFKVLGVPDLWRAVYSVCQKDKTVARSIKEIQIDCPWSEIPALVQFTLSAIENHGVTVTKTVPDVNTTQKLDVGKIKMLAFDDLNDAYEWIAKVSNLPTDTVIVNRDNVRLNHTLFTWDMPAVHSSLVRSNPQLLQLFKLSMSVLARPFNLQNLVAYLRLPMSPIPTKLRYTLAFLLTKNGGFGEKKIREEGNAKGKNLDDWENEIENYTFLNKDGKATVQAKNKKMPFLNVIREPYADWIPKDELIAYIEKLQKWLQGFKQVKDLPEAYVRQLHELSLMFSSLLTAVKTLQDKLQYDDIEKLVMQIYRPMNYTLHQPQERSMNVINDIRSMAETASMLIWLDCQAEDIESDPYDFLNTEERDYLSQNGVILPDFYQHLELLRSERIRLLNNVKEQVILVKSLYDGTTRLGEHSVVAELRYHCKNGLPTTTVDELFNGLRTTNNNTDSIDRFNSQFYYELGPIAYNGRKESNTSIDTLIQFPFDYVMEYVADLPNPVDEELRNTYLTLGLVAHYFFQHVIEDSNKDLKKMRAVVDTEFKERLEEAIDATGLILRQPENASQLHVFKWQLKDSMLALIDIMWQLGLKPDACEKNFPKNKKDKFEIEGIGPFGARIDFLLTNDAGNFVIFDFKWSMGKSYIEKMEKCNAIQLELYRQTVLATYKKQGKVVAGVGYYLMPKKQLVTYDFEEIPGSTLIKKIDKDNTGLYEKIKASYSYRMKEIREGHIEEAEMMDMKDVPDCYFADQKGQNLCPLETEEIGEGKGAGRIITQINKSSEKEFRPGVKNPFDKQEKEPSDTATSHSILKGRLK